ncbi:MAG: M28 family peptidase [Flavobacteriales bacterium]|jgi:aminopeptidase YwaD|nr:M28 family peptidase [Flavobacteriales bacterium]
MKTLVTAVVLLCHTLLSAQHPASVTDIARQYVDTLAAPGMHGRGYVQCGDSLAAEWLSAQFDRIGLEKLDGNRFQPFSFPVNTFPDSVKLRIGGKDLRPGLDFITDPASGSDHGAFNMLRITLEDLSVERKTQTWQTLEGRIALLRFPATTNRDSLALFAKLAEEVAQHAPVIRQGGAKLTWSVALEALPHAVIELLEGVMPDTATVAVINVKNRLVPKHDARNVFGVVRSKKRNAPWVLVTAHYDHLGQMGPDAIFPGANDNASGTAMLLCLAEWFKAHPPKANLLFISFAGEEAGLLGSSWCAAHPPIDPQRVKLLVNLDLNGTGEDGITVVNAVEQKKVFDKLVAINKRSKDLPQVKPRGPACNSDHCPFAQLGVPAIFIYTMGGVSFYHDVQDRPETLPLTKFDGLYRTLVTLIQKLK